MPSILASLIVAARKACNGVRPFATSPSTSRALSPCATGPESAPLQIVTPAAIAVLDRFHAGKNGALHSLRGRRVRRDMPARTLGDGHRDVEFLLCRAGHRFAVRTPAIVRVDLDPVGAVLDLIAHHAREALDAVRFFGALRDAVHVLRGESLRRILT